MSGEKQHSLAKLAAMQIVAGGSAGWSFFMLTKAFGQLYSYLLEIVMVELILHLTHL